MGLPATFLTWHLKSPHYRTTQPQPNLEVAAGKRYVLIQNLTAQTLTVVGKADDREVVQYDQQGRVLKAQPTRQDRQQWQAIAERV